MNEFVSISHLDSKTQDKINSKDITEKILFSLHNSRNTMYNYIFLIAADRCSLIIVSNFSCIQFCSLSWNGSIALQFYF